MNPCVQVKETEDYNSPDQKVQRSVKVYVADLKTIIQLLFSNPLTKWDACDAKQGARSFANIPFAKVCIITLMY